MPSRAVANVATGRLPGLADWGIAPAPISAVLKIGAGGEVGPPFPLELAPGERALVGTGLAVAIPEGFAGFVQPRSGLATKHGISIVNTPGLVDSGYRGELRVILLNTDPHEPFIVKRGERTNTAAGRDDACRAPR